MNTVRLNAACRRRIVVDPDGIHKNGKRRCVFNAQSDGAQKTVFQGNVGKMMLFGVRDGFFSRLFFSPADNGV